MIILFRYNVILQRLFPGMGTSTVDMRFSGGHPALDLANTVDSRRGRWGPDLLRSFEDLLILAGKARPSLDLQAASGLRSQAEKRSAGGVRSAGRRCRAA